MLIQLFGHRCLVMKSLVSADAKLRRKAEIGQALEELLRTVEETEELKISSWQTTVDVDPLQLKQGRCRRNEKLKEEPSYSQSGVAAVYVLTAEEWDKRLTPFWYEAAIQLLVVFIRYKLNRENRGYAYGTKCQIPSWMQRIRLGTLF